MSNSKKPIVHGFVDPTDIPYYCKKCKHYNSGGSGFPFCDRREDGKFRAEVAFSCYEVSMKESEPKKQKESDKD